MKRYLFLTLSAAMICGLIVSDSFARGGGRGGGGGGISRGGGGGSRPSVSRPSGGASRPSPSRGSSFSPSMSRPAGKPTSSRPSVSRPSTGSKPSLSNRPSTGSQPNFGGSRPSTGSRPEFSGNRPGASTNRPNFSGNTRPSQSGLQDFLDLPGQPGGGATRPNVGDRTNNITDRTNIGNKINDNTNVGNKVGDRTKIGDQTNVIDRTKIGDQTNIGDRTKIGDRTNVGDININAGNKININNRQDHVNSIRNKYNNVGDRPFNKNWWNGPHINDPHWHWHAGWNRYPANWCWRPCTWAAFGTWFAWSWAQPYNYDYGTNVVYRDNYVYVSDKQYASAEQYYDQAESIADSVPEDANPDDIEWMPLGVFAIAEEGGEDTSMVIQLAVSKEGIIAGTFYNEVANTSRPLQGMVDKQSQRAAWKFADDKNTDVVMETGVFNLTKDQATALVHYGADQTQTWLMVRLPEPEGDGSQAPAPQ